jgi:hypothetical protein
MNNENVCIFTTHVCRQPVVNDYLCLVNGSAKRKTGIPALNILFFPLSFVAAFSLLENSCCQFSIHCYNTSFPRLSTCERSPGLSRLVR